MIVCERCLQAIESHEGNQIKRKLGYINDADLIIDDNENVMCEWCEEEHELSECYEI